MRGAREPLCCCEYFNEHGDRSHILTCCCDCQAFDEICERLITCRSFDTTLTDRVKATMWDRCRFPYPGGAKTINWNLIGAILLPPMCLICSTFHFLVNAASLTAFISLILFFSQSRSELHFSFVISFLVTQVLIYATEIQPSLDIQYYENLVIYGTLIASGVCLFGAKYSKCPGGKQTPIYYLSWLNIPVYQHNFKWLLLGSCILIGTAFYASHLIFVSHCQMSSYLWALELPKGCPEIYIDFHHSISFQCGVFSLTGGLLLCSSVLNFAFRWPWKKTTELSII